MFQRGILMELNKWENAEKHKPFIFCHKAENIKLRQIISYILAQSV